METNLIEKISKIQKSLKAPKGQYNDFGKYTYRSCEDILEAVKPLLNGLLITLSDEMVLIGDRYYVKATATITDGEKDITVNAYSRESEFKKGMDSAQITGAASSYARKYALNGLLATDDNKDADTMDNTVEIEDLEIQKMEKEVNDKKTEKELGEYYLANKDTVRNKAFFNKIVVAKKATFNLKPNENI